MKLTSKLCLFASGLCFFYILIFPAVNIKTLIEEETKTIESQPQTSPNLQPLAIQTQQVSDAKDMQQSSTTKTKVEVKQNLIQTATDKEFIDLIKTDERVQESRQALERLKTLDQDLYQYFKAEYNEKVIGSILQTKSDSKLFDLAISNLDVIASQEETLAKTIHSHLIENLDPEQLANLISLSESQNLIKDFTTLSTKEKFLETIEVNQTLTEAEPIKVRLLSLAEAKTNELAQTQHQVQEMREIAQPLADYQNAIALNADQEQIEDVSVLGPEAKVSYTKVTTDATSSILTYNEDISELPTQAKSQVVNKKDDYASDSDSDSDSDRKVALSAQHLILFYLQKIDINDFLKLQTKNKKVSKIIGHFLNITNPETIFNLAKYKPELLIIAQIQKHLIKNLNGSKIANLIYSLSNNNALQNCILEALTQYAYQDKFLESLEGFTALINNPKVLERLNKVLIYDLENFRERPKNKSFEIQEIVTTIIEKNKDGQNTLSYNKTLSAGATLNTHFSMPGSYYKPTIRNQDKPYNQKFTNPFPNSLTYDKYKSDSQKREKNERYNPNPNPGPKKDPDDDKDDKPKEPIKDITHEITYINDSGKTVKVKVNLNQEISSNKDFKQAIKNLKNEDLFTLPSRMLDLDIVQEKTANFIKSVSDLEFIKRYQEFKSLGNDFALREKTSSILNNSNPETIFELFKTLTNKDNLNLEDFINNYEKFDQSLSKTKYFDIIDKKILEIRENQDLFYKLDDDEQAIINNLSEKIESELKHVEQSISLIDLILKAHGGSEKSTAKQLCKQIKDNPKYARRLGKHKEIIQKYFAKLELSEIQGQIECLPGHSIHSSSIVSKYSTQNLNKPSFQEKIFNDEKLTAQIKQNLNDNPEFEKIFTNYLISKNPNLTKVHQKLIANITKEAIKTEDPNVAQIASNLSQILKGTVDTLSDEILTAGKGLITVKTAQSIGKVSLTVAGPASQKALISVASKFSGPVSAILGLYGLYSNAGLLWDDVKEMANAIAQGKPYDIGKYSTKLTVDGLTAIFGIRDAIISLKNTENLEKAFDDINNGYKKAVNKTSKQNIKKIKNVNNKQSGLIPNSNKVKLLKQSEKELKRELSKFDSDLIDKKIIKEALNEFRDLPDVFGQRSPFQKLNIILKKKILIEGDYNNIKGIFYEIKVGLYLQKQNEKIISFGQRLSGLTTKKPTEFDIITSDKLIECKNWNWTKYNFDKLKSIFGQKQKIARELEKKLIVYSKNEIPQNFKGWLNSKGIAFFELS